ncbi:serine hydrolase domain-containing protein [Thermodesulfobacteriota bacterium]
MKNTILRFVLCILIFFLWWNVGLAADKKADYWPTNGWRTASPESQGVDSTLLVNMLDMIWEKDFAIDSVLVIRNGYIVLDAYGFPFNAEDSRHIQSCSKSVISVLVGIAIDQGYIKDVSQSVLEFFPNHVAKNLDTDKQAMTLEHVLTMTHGWECNDLYTLTCLTDMSCGGGWVQLLLDLPLADVPGSDFNYCNGAAFLLSAILQEQTSMNAFSFAEKYLFAPLGISDVHWPSNPQGITVGYNGLHMRPHDMAKIGYLYLNNGVWDGKQIISSQWIKDSTRRHITTNSGFCPGYGYQWWIVSPGIYTAIGAQGQYMMVAPEKNMLAVFTGSLSRKDTYIPLGLLAAYIIPAVKSPTPLPENPHAAKALKSVTTLWKNTDPTGREKINKIADKSVQRVKRNEYVNIEHGFTVNYDADLLIVDKNLEFPVVFRMRGLKGLPVFAVLVDDIPQGMALEYTADYMVDLYKRILPTAYHNTYHKIKKEELIKLSDGTDANYVEINWNVQSRGMLTTVGVFAYKNNKIIGAVAGSMEESPIEYLAGIAKSLKFTKR